MKSPKNNVLAIYLHDHLAAADFAIELLKSWEKSWGEKPLGIFATEMRTEIATDRAELERIIERVGASPHSMKEAAGWLAEKASRFKLRHEANPALGVFESLETLALGILGKLALWDALAVAAVSDPRLGGVNFDLLAARAKKQHSRVEARRINHAADVFSCAPGQDK